MTTRLGTTRTLGSVQKHVLLVLSTRGETSPADPTWDPLDRGQVYDAIAGLYRRGLVERRYEGNRCLWSLTASGLAAVDGLTEST